MRYKEGHVLLTSTLKFANLIPPDTQSAFFSSYCIDDGWFFEQLSQHSFSIWLATHYDCANGNQNPGISKGSVHGRPLTIIRPKFPPYMNYGIMHAKLIIYATLSFARVIVSSGNLMPCDYDEGPIQNILFVQDFPTGDGEKSEFYQDLSTFLTHLGGKEYLNVLGKYNFSDTKHVKLVFSVPGTAKINETTSGVVMLGRACDKLTCSSSELTIIAQGSSLGKITCEWLWNFYSTCCPGQRKDDDNHPPPIKIVFPTDEYAVKYGIDCFGTIWYESTNWDNCMCKSVFHKCAAKSPLHTKIICFQGVDNSPCYYIGSHNFTPAAWGRFTKAHDKLMINNYELGVLIDRPIPVPFKIPPDPYEPMDRPWMQNLYFGNN